MVPKTAFFGPSLKEAPLGSRPTALILSGGAALGSWQAGVVYAFEREHGLSFHSVAGTSAGSLNGLAYFQDTIETLRELWRDVPGGVFLKYAISLRPPSLHSTRRYREHPRGYRLRFRAPCRKTSGCSRVSSR